MVQCQAIQDGISDQDGIPLKQDENGVLILANGKSLVSQSHHLDFYPEKVSIMGVM